jgi:signal transduction histidine kinase
MENRLNAFNSTRLIASGRLLLAEFLLFYATSDPEGFGFQWKFDDMFAFGYSILALLVLVVAWRSWWADFILFPAIFAVDILVFLTMPWALSIDGSNFSAAAVPTASFILLCSSVRWNARSTVIFALALNLASLALALVGPENIIVGKSASLGAISSLELRHLMLLALVSVFIVWAGLRLNDPHPGKFAPRWDGGGSTFAAEAVEAAMKASGASGGAIAWTREDESEATIVVRQPQGPVTVDRIAADRIALRGLEDAPILFDLARRRVIRFTPDQEFAAHRPAELDRGMLERLGFASGISIPLRGVTGTGQLVLTGIPLLSWDHLRSVNALASEVTHAIDGTVFEQAARDAALVRLRQAVARDLHDSVAQSLAGARFWLQALKARAARDQDLVTEIEQVEEALVTENLHIRALIEQLRREERARGLRDLTADLDDLLTTLSLHWRIETERKGPSGPYPVPYQLSFDVQQVVREAIANAVRHGRASRVGLEFKPNGTGFDLSIRDNGSGFGKTNPAPSPVSITERVALLGGTLEIITSDEGARLDMHIPHGGQS